MPKATSTINLSYTSIIRVIVVLAIVALIYIIWDALALLFVAIIFSAAVDPWVDWLQQYKFPRAASILMIYIILLAIFSLVIVLMIPPITEQIGQIINNFPGYYEKISMGVHSLQDRVASENSQIANDSIVNALENLSTTLAQTTRSIFVTITSIFGGLFSLLMVLVMTFYVTVEEDALKKFVKIITKPKYRSYIMNLIDRMQLKIGLWLRGQLMLSLVVGILTYIGLSILGVKYALLLAIVAGIFEIIPYLGPWLSAIPAVIVTFSDSFTKVILVAIVYLFIQQLENHLIVPKLMHRMVGLNPIVVIMAILIGFKLGGAVGGLIGVPVAAAISVYLDDVFKEKKDGRLNTKSS